MRCLNCGGRLQMRHIIGEGYTDYYVACDRCMLFSSPAPTRRMAIKKLVNNGMMIDGTGKYCRRKDRREYR